MVAPLLTPSEVGRVRGGRARGAPGIRRHCPVRVCRLRANVECRVGGERVSAVRVDVIGGDRYVVLESGVGAAPSQVRRAWRPAGIDTATARIQLRGA
jgi:hypothetical protein